MAFLDRSTRQFSRALSVCFFTSIGAFLLLIVRLEIENQPDTLASGRPAMDKYKITQIKIFPQGGGEVSAEAPWVTPPSHIHTSASEFHNPTKSFIISNFSFSPGQGNIMFQYASLYALSIRLNATLLLPSDSLLRRAFALDATVISPRVSRKLLATWPRHTFTDCCRYYPEVDRVNATGGAALFGYFQSFQYFSSPREAETIRAQFEYLPAIRQKASSLLSDTLRLHSTVENRTLVGVHVRRGLDVTWNSRNIAHGHKAATKRYYRRAMEHFRRTVDRPIFLFATDDPAWTSRSVLEGSDDALLLPAAEREVHMCALTLCQHTIMSQGTFSWWTAYLTGGDVVYYKDWPRNGSKLAAMVRREDYFPQNWIPMA